MDKITGQVVSKKEINGQVTTKGNISGTLGMPMGVVDYNLLTNKPSIEEVPLIGDKSLTDFGERGITNLEIQEIINHVFN